MLYFHPDGQGQPINSNAIDNAALRKLLVVVDSSWYYARRLADERIWNIGGTGAGSPFPAAPGARRIQQGGQASWEQRSARVRALFAAATATLPCGLLWQRLLDLSPQRRESKQGPLGSSALSQHFPRQPLHYSSQLQRIR